MMKPLFICNLFLIFMSPDIFLLEVIDKYWPRSLHSMLCTKSTSSLFSQIANHNDNGDCGDHNLDDEKTTGCADGRSFSGSCETVFCT